MFPDWFKIALLEYGEKEIPGPKDNKRITQYFLAAPEFRGSNKDETPWCAVFANWCLSRSGIPGTNKALARSFLNWGTSCGPTIGAITVLWRGKRNSPFGHVGFLVRELEGNLHLLGGNQSNQVSISVYPSNRLLSFRFPN